MRYLTSLNKIKENVAINRYQSVYSIESLLRHSDPFSVCDINGIIGKCASERKQICQSSLLKSIADGKKPLVCKHGKSSVLFVINIPRDYPRS